jgi:molybdopterin converting factor small subunit
MAPDDRSDLITVKLFGGLDERVPAAAGGRLELSAATLHTVGELLAAAGLPPGVTGLVFVNGLHAEPATAVIAGDVVSLFPPLSGG